jgi:hypothetical protein
VSTLRAWIEEEVCKLSPLNDDQFNRGVRAALGEVLVKLARNAVKPSCGACRFWKRYGTAGECRRLAAVRVEPVPDNVWAFTREDDWCGEFAMREEL